MSKNGWKVPMGDWEWAGWTLFMQEPYIEILEMSHDPDDAMAKWEVQVAIANIPKMLEFIRDVKETCVYQRTLVDRAEALLAGLHEDFPDG